MRVLREEAGLDSRATADCCPTVCLSQLIYSGATKKQLDKEICFLGLPSDFKLQCGASSTVESMANSYPIKNGKRNEDKLTAFC